MPGSPEPPEPPETAEIAIGAVIVTYRAEAYIGDCLESLMSAAAAPPWVVVVDNASPDGTVAALRAWAAGRAGPRRDPPWPFEPAPPPPKPVALSEWAEGSETACSTAPRGLTLIHSGVNRGFAGGVNLGLAALMAEPRCTHIWVLNPDMVVPPEALGAFARAAAHMPHAGLLGGRVRFLESPGTVHTDGGQLRRWRGGAVSLTLGRSAATPMPPAARLDFVSGASLLASRAFVERAGPMAEDYFLYFEEIDWALRRGPLEIGLAEGADVFHRAGAAIGSGSAGAPQSPLAAYFTWRNHLRFAARWFPWWLPSVYAMAWVQIARRLARRGAWAAVGAALRGLHGLPPPAAVAAEIGRSPQRRRRGGIRLGSGSGPSGPRSA